MKCIVLFEKLVIGLFFVVVLCSCGPSKDYCSGSQYHANSASILDLIEYDLCGNLYRFKHNSELKINVQSDEVLRKSNDYKNYFSRAILDAFNEWNLILSKYGVRVMATHEESPFTLNVERLPVSEEKLLLGITKFHVDKLEEDRNNIFSYQDFEISTEFSIDSVDIVISPVIPGHWSDTFEMNEDGFRRTVMHEIGHMLGIYGHSKDDSDIMSKKSANSSFRLSPRDIRTINHIYTSNIDLEIIPNR